MRERTAATASRVMTTGALLFWSARTAWMRPSRAWMLTGVRRNSRAFIAWYWGTVATLLCPARSAGRLRSSGRRGRGLRAAACRENGRTVRSTPERIAQYAWSRGGDGAPTALHRGVWVVAFASTQAYNSF